MKRYGASKTAMCPSREIDQDMVAFGMPVGPFMLLDTVGLDIAFEVARILHRSYGPRMAPAPLLEALVKAGRWGVKSGRGFYEYSEFRGTERRSEPRYSAAASAAGRQV
jgi:3-hydroxyacyl-CoA dehydrogenase